MFIPDLEYKKILEYLPIVCVDLLIIYDNKCLLLFRNNEPAKGQYWFPGGRINKMETIRDASIRKAKEETNLNCEFIDIVSVEETIFNDSDLHTINICCYLTVNNIDKLQFDKYHSDYKWVDEESDKYHKSVNYPISQMKFKK